MTDIELIKRCQQNDWNAMNLLYEQHSKKALFTARMITGRINLAEDIMQEAFIQCFKSISNLKNPEFFETWFYRIIYRVACLMAKKEKNRDSFECEEIKNIGNKIDSGMDTHEKFETNEIFKAILKAVNNMKPEVRMTVVLFYFQNYSIKEIAKVLQCFESTVKSRLFKARKYIRRELEKQGFESEITSKEYLNYEKTRAI